MGDKLILRRGVVANIPTLDDGEPGFTTDTKQLYVGIGGVNTLLNGAGATGVGIQGATGVGVAGSNGAQGLTGIAGINGVTGVAGVNGSQGVTGVAGSNGSNGVTGVAGVNGSQGVTGVAGSNGAQGATGVFGQSLTATGVSYVPAVAGNWFTGVQAVPTQVAQALDELVSLGNTTAFYKVAPSGAPYTSVQTAINQAVADGHTTNGTNSAYILVYPGLYTENLTFKNGVHVISAGTNHGNSYNATANVNQGGEVVIVGNHTFSPLSTDNANNRSANSLVVKGIILTVLNGVTFTYSGTGSSQIFFFESYIQKQSGGDVNAAVVLSNSNNQARIRFNDSIVFHEVAGSDVVDVQTSATVEFRGRLTSVTSLNGVTLNSAVKLAATSTLNIQGPTGFTSGPFTQVFNIQSATCVINADKTSVQTTNTGGILVNLNTFANNGNVRFRQCGMFMADATSRLAAGTSFNYTFTVSAANATAGATYTNNGVTFTVVTTISGGTSLLTTGGGVPTSSGTLTKATGTGDATITFSAVTSAATSCGINVVACAFSGAIATPFTNQDANVRIFTNPGGGAQDSVRNALYVGGGRGYPTIAAALTASNTSGGAGGSATRKTIFISPGTYTENLTFVGQVDLVADTLSDNATNTGTVKITGTHTWAAAANNDNVKCKGIHFNQAKFTMSGSTSGNRMYFYNCIFINSLNDAASMFSVTHSNSPIMILKDCSASLSSDAGSLFDFSSATAPTVMVEGNFGDVFNSNGYSLNPSTLSQSSGSFFKGGSGFNSILFQKINGSFSCARTFQVASSNTVINIRNCNLSAFGGDMEFIKFNSNGFVDATSSTVFVSGNGQPGGYQIVARDGGVQSSGTLVVNSAPSGGDTITVNGVVFTAGTDFAVGGTNTITATNIVNAIALSADVALVNIVYAVSSGAIVTIKAVETGTAGDANTIASSNGAAITASGATLAGGTNGSGGSFSYGACQFIVTKYQSSLTVNEYQSVLTPI